MFSKTFLFFDIIGSILNNPFEESIITVEYFSTLYYDFFFLLYNSSQFSCIDTINTIYSENNSFLNSFFIDDSSLVYTFFSTMFTFLYTFIRLTNNNQQSFFSFSKTLYMFVYNKMIWAYLEKEADHFVNYFYFIFLVLLSHNIHGLQSFGFSLTSNLSYTFYISMCSWVILVSMIGWFNDRNSLLLFVPNNLPFVMFPLYIGIEILSYLIRMLSLALRIFANIVSGHLLIETLCNIASVMIISSKLGFDIDGLLFFIPLCLSLTCIFIFEFLIGILQAYIFVTLLIIYLHDLYNCIH